MGTQNRSATNYCQGALQYIQRGDVAYALQICQQGLLLYPEDVDLLRIAKYAATHIGDAQSAAEYGKRAYDAEQATAAAADARAKAIANKLEDVGSGAATVSGVAVGSAGVIGSVAVGAAGLGLLTSGAVLTPGCGCIIGIPMILLGVFLIAVAAYILFASFGAAATLGTLGFAGFLAARKRRKKSS